MRNIFTIIFLSLLTNIFCQNSQISGHITLSNSETEYKNLTILLVKNDSVITGAVPNETGFYKLEKKVPTGKYRIKITQLAARDFVLDSVSVYKDIDLNILYTGKCLYVKSRKPKCIKNHYDKIIPIVYGLPSEKTMRKAKKGLIHLGGCEIYGCDPNYYCTIHKIEF